jgi:hypothetical protein
VRDYTAYSSYVHGVLLLAVMTAALAAPPIGSLVGVIDLVQALALGRTANANYLDGMPKTRQATDSVLEAENLADLTDRLDVMFLDLVEFGPELDSLKAPGDPALDRVLGVTSAGEIRSTTNRALPQLEALVKMLAGLNEQSDEESADFSTFVDVAYDLRWPLPARKTYMEVFRGLLAALVIVRAVEKGRRLDSWLAMALTKAITNCIELVATYSAKFAPFITQGGARKLVEHYAPEIMEAKRYEDFLVSHYPSESTTA